MVYVDNDMSCLSNKNWPFKTVCHLEADTEAELDAIARKLRLVPSWKQPPRRPRYPWPHFDITPGKRRHAIRLGAVAQSNADVVARWRRWRQEGWPVETPSERR